MLQRWLLLWLILLSVVAYTWPTIAGYFPLGVTASNLDPFTGSAWTLPWLIALTMFAIGLMLPRDEVAQVASRWPTVLAGTAIQYTAMPLLAFVVARAWGLTGDYLVGVMLVGCVPGAMASNVLTLNAGGNTSYSVSLTTMATLLSPFAVPLTLQLTLAAEESVQQEPLGTSLALLRTVVFPVLAGHLLTRRFPGWEGPAHRWGARVANLSILWIIAVVVAGSRSELRQFRLDVVSGLLCINLAGYLTGFLGGSAIGVSNSMRRALTLEIGMQNAGLGATLATQFYPDRPVIAIAPALYTFGCMLTGTILARFWSTRPLQESPNSDRERE